MQTHISYLGLVGGLGRSSTVVVLAWNAFRRAATTGARVARCGGGAAISVVARRRAVDPAGHRPVRALAREPRHHPRLLQPSARLDRSASHRGVGVLLAQLDPWKLLTRTLVHDGGALEVDAGRGVPGALLLLVFGASVVVAWRLRHRLLLLARRRARSSRSRSGLVSAARIFGTVWFYLLLWAWGLAALMLLAIGWTVVELVRARANRPRHDRASSRRVGARRARGGDAGRERWCSRSRRRASPCRRRGSTSRSARSSGPTADALTQLQSTGQRGPYLVTWLPDAEAIGSAGFGLLNELDRRGFDVRAEEPFRPAPPATT